MVLHNADYAKSFYVQVDASDPRLGAVLSHDSDSGEEHPIAFRSRKLSPRECAFPTIEKECIGIIWAIK